MTTFILTFAISFILLLTIGLFISYSKRRQRKTNHGLTGMCHETGGEMCGGCSSYVLNNRAQTSSDRTRPSCCDRPAPAPAPLPTTRND